jgi:hypothetical protein
MSLIEKLPHLSDDEVMNLLANARRLHDQGDDKQRAAAAELLPALEDVATQRRTARQDAIQAKRAASRRPKSVAA